MSWQDRLSPTLGLTSPEGSVFIVHWQGDPRSMEKKLGIFELPGLKGALVQDLQVGATRDQLRFFIEGGDHDILAGMFFEACKERGAWAIDHPVLGRKTWQLVNVKEEIDPTASANITAFTTEWIEPINVKPSEAPSQLASAVRNRVATVIEKANQQAEDTVDIGKPSAIAQLKNAAKKTADKIRLGLSILTSTSSETTAVMDGVYRAIVNTVQSDVLDVVALMSQIQTMLTTPADSAGDLPVRLTYYSGLITSFTGDGRNTNAKVVQDLSATSGLAAMAQATANSELTTREEAIGVMEQLLDTYNTALGGLDANQNGDYVSQSSSYNDAALLVSSTLKLLLRRSFDLAAAKRIVLTRSRCPVEIALTEGVDLDVFIATNGLKGEDILLLAPGREVVVYL